MCTPLIICLGHLEIQIFALSNPNIDVRILPQGYNCVSSLVYPYFELDNEQDEIRQALLINS